LEAAAEAAERNSMNYLITLVKPLIKKGLKMLILKDNFRQMVISHINSKVQLPKLDKAQEERLINQIYVALQEAILEIIAKL